MSFKNALSTGNTKMKATMAKHPDILLKSFSMPAGLTCPNAGECKKGCYAYNGRMKLASKGHMENLVMYFKGTLWKMLDGELTAMEAQAETLDLKPYVRIHDSGDFFNRAYLRGWMELARKHPTVQFYAFSKMVRMVHEMSASFPPNLTIVLSYGGLEDLLIEDSDRQAIVVPKDFELPSGWVDGSKDDWHASQPTVKRIALRYHGPKSKEFQTIL